MNTLKRLLAYALLLFAGGFLLSMTATGCNEPHQRYYYYRDYREPDYYEYYDGPVWGGERHEEHEWAEHHEHHEGHRR